MKKELLYVVAIIAGVILATGILFGFENFSGDTTFEVNIGDTYFVIPKIYLLLLFMLLLTVFAWFVRILFTRFEIKYANYIFLFFNTLLMIYLILICKYLGDFNEILREGLSETTSREMATSMNKVIANFLYSAYFAIVLSVFIEIVVIFKTRKLHQNTTEI